MKKIFVVSLLFALLGAACGDGDRTLDAAASPSPSPSVEGSPEPTETPADTASPTPTMTDGEKAPIEVTSPASGAEVSSGFVLAGEANVFEANVRYRLRTQGGRVLVDDFTTATCGSGCRGDFQTKVRYRLDKRTDAVLEVFEESAEDGSDLHLVELPLVLLP